MIAAVCGTVIAATATFSVSAATLKTDWPGVKIPIPKNYTWSALGEVTGTEKGTNYFVIHTDTTDGAHAESLYVSFPKEGGFRIQSLHELQKQNGAVMPEVSNVGLFEPSALQRITYITDGNAVGMKGTDGTVVKYTQSDTGFALTVYKANSDKIVSLSNKQFSFAYNRRGEVVRSMVEFPLADKEAIYGGGERYNGANQVGKTISLTNLDCWSLPEYSYNNVPLFHSNRGYSVWFNMSYVGEADIGETNRHKYSVKFDGAKLDLYLWQGMPLDNLKKYTALTGTSGVSETWTYGFWTGAQNEAFEKTGLGNTYANIMELINGYKEHYNFYPDACYAEGAAARNAQVTSFLRRNNVKTLGWFSPDLWKDLGLGTIYDILPTHSELPAFDAGGNLIDPGQPFGYDTTFFKKYGKYRITSKSYVDFSNPSSVELITAAWQQYWDWGIAGSMVDFGEWYPFSMTYFNGLTGDEMHNLMSYYYAKASNEAWQAGRGNDYVLFQRSGCAGSQYYSGNFLGDNVSEYVGEDGNGYNAVISALISMGASGFNLYGADLGGLGGTPSNDLWNRWVSLSLFSPYMRQHGTVIHQPWNYGMLATQHFGNVYYLRKNLVPTIESAAIKAEKTADPIIKGMVMAYPYQLSLAKVENQYLFCDDFLVSAVTQQSSYFKQVPLPKGSTWYNLSNYKAHKGGQYVTEEAPTSTMPVYVRGGSVKAINLPESMKLGAEMHDDSGDEYEAIPSLLITPPDGERTSTIYVKDGESKDFRTYDSHTEVYTNAPGEGVSFTVTNTAGSPRQIVLALGVTASSVTVDGTALQRFDHTPDYYNEEYGYTVDPDGTTTMLLPKNWKSLTIVKGDAQYDPLKLYANTNGIEGMLDDDCTTVDNVRKSFELELDEPGEIGRVVVKWAVGYYDSYDISYSEDGETWTTILPDETIESTVENGCGSVDDIRFDAVKATYLRFDMKDLGDVTTMDPAIYELKAYAPVAMSEIPDLPEEADPSLDEDEIGDDDWDIDPDDDNKDDDNNKGDKDDGKTDSTKKKKKKLIISYFPTWAIILLIGAGVLLVTGLIFLFLLLRRKKKKAQEAAALADGTTPTEDFPKLE